MSQTSITAPLFGLALAFADPLAVALAVRPYAARYPTASHLPPV